jgi:hypothetical protein
MSTGPSGVFIACQLQRYSTGPLTGTQASEAIARQGHPHAAVSTRA